MSNENKSDLKQTKDEKYSASKKQYSPTIRLTITLREPDGDSCSVFDYLSLLAEELQDKFLVHQLRDLKRNREREKEKKSKNGPSEENEELDDEVKKLAQHFEEKYGTTATKKKKKKKAPTFYNYSELAAGYDENDSFIDNSEAFDEALPDEMETFHGGYYVNCGQLEFKKIALMDDTADADEIKMVKKKNCALKSDDSNLNDESSRSDLNSELEDDDAESALKKLPEETCAKDIEADKNSHETNKVADKLPNDKTWQNAPEFISMNGEIAQKKRKKYKKRRLSEDTADDQMSRPKKKALTVKLLLEEKRIVENGENCGSGGKINENFHNSINDVIESVVNAARNHSEDSRDSVFSSSDAKSIDSRTSYDTEKENHVEEVEVIELVESVNGDAGFSQILKDHVKLPDNLPSDVSDLVTQIKNSAQNSELGARTFFNSHVNSILLSLETRVRSLTTNTRHTLYGYLANFLPCSKDTLMKRAKKLLVEEEETRMAELFKKLRHNIEKTMPTLTENYVAALKQFNEEKNAGGFNKNGEFDEKKACSRTPSRKFVWTEEMRSYVRDLISCHLKYVHMLKPKKELSDECIKKFLEAKVKPLWPAGWMSTTTLLKEAQIKSISSKVKKMPAANTVTNAKKAHTSVPTSSNTSTTTVSASANYNLLTSSLALQSLSMQYSSQPDPVYPVTCSTSIPYCPDLSIISAASLSSQASTLPVPMSILSRIAASNNQYPSNVPYSKSTSPPKKQTASSFVSARSTTSASVTTQPSVSFVEGKKIAEAPSSKYNDFKIDSLINSSKPKKEHHMLNHISQYNKHYSHKGEKRKSGNNEKKEAYTLSKSPVNPSVSSSNNYNSCNNNNGKLSHSSGSSSAVSCNNLEQAKAKSSDQVLDLSPNKVTKVETKVSNVGQSHANTSSLGSASITASDHSYWSSTKKEVDKKEESRHDLMITTVVPESVNGNQNANPKPTHISRKQRILQESKSVTYEVAKTWPEKNNPTDCGAVLRTSQDSVNSRIESPAVNIKCIKNLDEKLVVPDEKRSVSLAEEKKMMEETTTATDILSKIIDDTLQDNSTPLPPQFVIAGLEGIKKIPEIEIRERENTRNGETEMTLHLCKKESPRHLQEKSYSALNSDRKTPTTDRAEMEAAEVINDLLVLNQLGGHSIPRRMDFQDSSRYADKNINEFNRSESNINQSSLLSSDVRSSSSRFSSLSGFQDEFFKHIFKDHNSQYDYIFEMCRVIELKQDQETSLDFLLRSILKII